METISMTSLTLAALLNAGISGSGTHLTKENTYILPKIAGQWQAVLDEQDDKAAKIHANANISRTNDSMDNDSMDNDIKMPDKTIDGHNNHDGRIATWQKPSKICRELYAFDRDNFMRTSSANEVTYGNYVVLTHEEGLPILILKTIYDNNEVDCSGNQVDQTGEQVIAYIKEDGNTMQWCGDKLGEKCHIRFERVLP